MNLDRSNAQSAVQTRGYDEGLRAHMLRVYNRMTVGVLVTAITALVVASSPALLQFFVGGPQVYLIMFAPMAIVLFGFNPAKMSSSQLRISFLAISALYGISFSVILLVFTGESIARAFFIASAMFAGLSIFGYTTKKDLSPMVSFLVMGMVGVLVMSLLNQFIFKSPQLFDFVSMAGIVVFAGLTAWQTQATKLSYNPSNTDEINSRMSWMSALNLYIAFIAMFQFILHFVGQQR